MFAPYILIVGYVYVAFNNLIFMPFEELGWVKVGLNDPNLRPSLIWHDFGRPI